MQQRYEESRKTSQLDRFKSHCKLMRDLAGSGKSGVESHYKEFSWRMLHHKSMENWKQSNYCFNMKERYEQMEYTKTKMMSLVLLMLFFSKFRRTSLMRSFKGKAGLSTAYFAELAMRVDKNCCSSTHVMERFLTF
ncbi:unnamed protein product [Moneuplotes crassus]|uniref:Uncharacterized protein n=1 Tax=Euplotes crassus TaxID=5936 RepID=A0AAD1XIH3_EUPCR|nr:unnamed protein product [Moneuplotes crassus]